MSKLLLIHNDNEQLISVITEALRAHGYTASAVSSTDRTADITVTCAPTDTPHRSTIGSITIDFDNVCVYDANRHIIHFTPIEFSMLSYLAKNAHRAVSRNELLPAVWGFENTDSSRVADDTAKRLRRKLKDTDLILETVWKFGFRIRVKE